MTTMKSRFGKHALIVLLWTAVLAMSGWRLTHGERSETIVFGASIFLLIIYGKLALDDYRKRGAPTNLRVLPGIEPTWYPPPPPPKKHVPEDQP